MARAAKRAAARLEVTPEAADEGATTGGLIGLINLSCRHVALLAAIIATCGSLFFSEVLRWIPCQLCWYQRILMYPLVAILGVGIWRGDRKLHQYVLPLSLTGIAVSLYHYMEVLKIITPPPCAGAVPCSIDYINFQGALSFVKIPFLALAAFIIISVMMGNFALAGDDALPVSGRGQRIAIWSAGAIVAVTIVVFVALGAML